MWEPESESKTREEAKKELRRDEWIMIFCNIMEYGTKTTVLSKHVDNCIELTDRIQEHLDK